jgi:hypothetical protein
MSWQNSHTVRDAEDINHMGPYREFNSGRSVLKQTSDGKYVTGKGKR